MAYTEESFVLDYNSIYQDIVANAMELTAAGKDTPLEKLFNLIDSRSNDSTITDKEALSLKKDAYMQIVATIVTNSQKTAIELVRQKYMYGKELDQADSNKDKTVSETALLDAKTITEGNVQTKTTSESELIEQKTITEFHQTGTTTKTGIPVDNSIIGKQINLYEKQAAVFAWNTEAKVSSSKADVIKTNIATSGVPETVTNLDSLLAKLDVTTTS